MRKRATPSTRHLVGKSARGPRVDLDRGQLRPQPRGNTELRSARYAPSLSQAPRDRVIGGPRTILQLAQRSLGAELHAETRASVGGWACCGKTIMSKVVMWSNGHKGPTTGKSIAVADVGVVGWWACEQTIALGASGGGLRALARAAGAGSAQRKRSQAQAVGGATRRRAQQRTASAVLPPRAPHVVGATKRGPCKPPHKPWTCARQA